MSEDVYLKGKVKWPKLVNPDLQYKCWSLVLYPDAESMDKIRKLQETDKNGNAGILNVMKKDEDGENMTFKRPTEKVIKGVLRAYQPPILLEADAKSPLPGDVLIGNGSDVTIKLERYTYTGPTKKKGSAVRLVSVRVDNLVPYEMKKDFTDEQTQAAQGLEEQPAPNW